VAKDAERRASVRLLQEVVRVIQAESSYRSIVRRVLALERLYSAAAADEAERRLMRFQTEKMLFDAALDRGAVFRTVQRRFRAVLRLPCDYLPSYLISLVMMHIVFANYCGRRGRSRAGIRLLEGLATDLERWKGSVPKGMLSYCRSQVAQHLRRLRKGQLD